MLDPSPARVIGHPASTPLEQLAVTNINPNLGAPGGMYSPQGVAVDTTSSTHILYVADTANNRVLAWKNASSSTLTNLQAPDFIIGQPNTTTTFALTNGGLYYPTGLLVDSKGNLYVADSGNNRILRYPTPSTNSNTAPDIVLGQHDRFTSRTGNQGSSVSQFTVCLFQSCPQGAGPFIVAMAMDSSGNLFVTDSGNDRVLRFPAASLTAGAVDPAADMVVGQASMTKVNGPSGTLDKSTLYIPGGVAFDAEGHLFVSDALNRVLVFPSSVSSATPTNFISAIRIAGVVTPSPSTATGSTFSNPAGIVMINDGPAVVDSNNNRTLIFDAFSSADWTLASGDTTLANPAPVALAVLGQGSDLTAFTSTKVNAGNPQASTGGVATFSGPTAAAIAGTDLFIVDSNNNRVLVYGNVVSGTQVPAAASIVLGQSDFLYNSPNSIQGKEFYFSSGFSSSADSGIAVDSSSGTPRLYVSDPNNHRVLGFADARKVGAGVKADVVIGQPDFKTAVCNYGGVANPAGERLTLQPTQSSLCYPTGLAVDPATGDLYVADSENGRVLRFAAPFNSANSAQQANLVLGQSGFTGVSNPQASQSVMVFPYGLLFDPARGLMVSDWNANRVLIFTIAGATNGSPAAKVVGQSSFTATSNTVLSVPHHIAEDSIGQLYVADTGHNQIQVFLPTGSITDKPEDNPYQGFSAPEAVWVNPNNVAGYMNNVWVGDGNGLWLFPVRSLSGTAQTPTLAEPAVEIQGGSSLSCPGSSYCSYPAVAIAQDAYGALYVADATNRVAIHYPALRATNSANYACAMGCALPGSPETYGQSALAPGALATLFPIPVSSTWVPFTTNPVLNSVLPVPTTLGGVQVLVNGQLSPIVYAGTGQINFIIPNEAPTSGTAQVVVQNAATSQVLGSGSTGISPGVVLGLSMNSASPAFFTASANGAGQIAALNCNKVENGNCDDTLNGTTIPANQGSVIQLYLTGQGLVPNAPADGEPPAGAINTSSTPAVYVGGTLASVTYSGLAPGFPGLWQINLTVPTHPAIIPTNFASGVFPVQVSYEGLTSNTPTNNRTPCPSPPTACATTIVINPPQ